MSLAQIQTIFLWKSKFQSVKMPDWEQMFDVGVADAWRVVRKEVVIPLSPCYCSRRWRRRCFLDFWLCHICFKLTSTT